MQNILTSFDEFTGNEILCDRQGQDYRSVYLDLYAEFRKDKTEDKEQINDDVVFEIELIKQVELNVDYILILVQKYRNERGDGDDKEIRAEITRAVDASPTLRNKNDLIEDFVDSLSVDGEIDQEWRTFIAAKRDAELDRLVPWCGGSRLTVCLQSTALSLNPSDSTRPQVHDLQMSASTFRLAA